MTPYQRHVERWSSCERCPLYERRNHVVLARGSVPSDVFFVGEAPGASEDVLGRPFCGPAGHLLDRIVAEALAAQDEPVKCAYTNLVACIPKTTNGGKAGEPSEECVEACRPRLQEFIGLCRPDLVVCVGALAQKFLPQITSYVSHGTRAVVGIVHPAAILRMDPMRRGLAVRQAVVTLADAVREIE